MHAPTSDDARRTNRPAGKCETTTMSMPENHSKLSLVVLHVAHISLDRRSCKDLDVHGGNGTLSSFVCMAATPDRELHRCAHVTDHAGLQERGALAVVVWGRRVEPGGVLLVGCLRRCEAPKPSVSAHRGTTVWGGRGRKLASFHDGSLLRSMGGGYNLSVTLSGRS